MSASYYRDLGVAQARRAEFCKYIEIAVERNGFAEVAVYGSDSKMDDPPMHWIMEWAMREHELETRGRDLPPLRTLVGDLREMAQRRDWRIFEWPERALVRIEKKLKPVECEECHGRCYLMRNPWDFSPMAVMEVCGTCAGRGTVDRLA